MRHCSAEVLDRWWEFGRRVGRKKQAKRRGGAMITVERVDDGVYKVIVAGPKTTTHNVTVNQQYYQKLTGGKVSIEDLLRRSFEFLLDREVNTSILLSFDLSVIAKYFPAYESEISKSLTA
jgi:hypothetical protein